MKNYSADCRAVEIRGLGVLCSVVEAGLELQSSFTRIHGQGPWTLLNIA